MTPEDKNNPSHRSIITLSPWLVIAGGLLLYGLTLNHWVSLRSLPLMAQMTGWDWHPYPLKWRPETMAPLFLVLTAPVRLLPAGWQPAALNVFTAACAALTLGLLARSVRLMPQDRTREQRLLEMGDNALLSIRAAFLPALFAVLMLATQLTFWQNAVAATGEMLNLLVFAVIIDCILEYRLTQNDKWLLASALVYGLGASSNWALLGFFPLYILAVLMVKGLFGFINPRFLARMFLLGLAGLALYLLMPILGSLHGGNESFTSGFAYLLGRELGMQSFGLRLVPHWMALVAAVPTVLPLIFACIKWPAFEGELSHIGHLLTRFMFGVMHAAFLVLALATFFEFKYSPSARMHEMPVSFLTFYYMGALSIGYFCGYLLLIFGRVRSQAWERRRQLTKVLNFSMLAVVWLIALGAPALLAWETYPHIRAGSSSTLRQFADQILAGLPSRKAVVLSDDATRLYLLQAASDRHGKSNEHILIDTESFPHRDYIYYLVSRYPELKSVMTTNLARLPRVLNKENLMNFMTLVTRNYPVYYLHPSFGYYFEALYLKPQGVVYELKPYTTNMTQPPLPTEAEIKANQSFWARMEKGPLQRLPELAKLDMDAEAVSVDYAVGLDYWGTELQKANHLKEAHDQFAAAVRLNTNNFIAAINLQYNERLQKGDHRPIEDSAETLFKAMYYYGTGPVLRGNGPADEPGLDLQLGEILAQGRNLGQATILFQRRLQFLPGDAEAQLAMAKTYADLRQPAKALELIRKLRASSKVNPWELSRCEALAYLYSGDYATAEQILRKGVQADPKDANRVGTLAEFYRVRGLEALRSHMDGDAARAFTNALASMDLQLQLLTSSSRESFNVPEILLKKADLQTMIGAYGAVVSTLSQVLQLQPKNYSALLNRGVAEIQIKQFQAARDDFKALGKLLPDQPYLVEFGLAQVAFAQQNKPEEIDHLKRCAGSAPKESNEYARATNRLAALERR